ncbi:hypothetical protein DH2020_033466 [Rehmannia glutinosa]|uniref:AAA+ ATPase domain-containing protein n=1 Tax=Rehmannia glutinosa TaxID=99300 RepID=A0ABR0VC84_REHGL
MRLSRPESVVKRRKDKNFRNKFKGKKKHKRLDAICENAFNRSHKGVEKVEPSELNNGENELELRRSNRARRAPELLDSSPLPPKKRQKVDRSVAISVEKVRREDRVQRETPCSSLRDLDEQNGGWGPRDDMEPKCDDKKEGLVGEKSTVVKSKRPGRIKASNVLPNENQEIDLDGAVEDVQRDSGLQECHINGNMETREENMVSENLACDVLPDQGNVAEVDCATADQAKYEGHPDKPLEDEPLKKSKGKYNASAVAERKPRIKLGRRCGLCGGGTDGKPPKILVLEGAGSDNEAYSGSSASEEPNYDVWDGFGDQAGWLGRLLGPINDRFGIAGIWVHQQCAVWSPEIADFEVFMHACSFCARLADSYAFCMLSCRAQRCIFSVLLNDRNFNRTYSDNIFQVYFAGLGCLKNVRAALYRGRVLKCSRCQRPGATIGCRPCARAKGCIFDHRKFLIACTDHRHLFQPHGIQNAQRLKKMKAKKLKLELRKMANDACRKDIEAEEKWLENCGEDEEFLKRESKRLHRDLLRIAPTYIGGANSEREKQFQGWESVAGLQDVIGCMKEVVILPLLYPEFFNNLGLTPPRGVLLHGYPGTGKTLVVRALVGSCARGDRRIAYFARKGADCLGKYVGDAERQLRLLFQVAEKSQPSIIFFDEIDGLAPCRTKQQDQTHNSVVSTLLALMDGLKSRGSVIVIGATNRPDAVDPALRRPGRFDREIYFPLPSIKDREAILSLHTQKWPKPVTGSLLKWVAKQTVGFAGADLQALCTQAAIIALRRSFPLQEVLSAAESRATDTKCPSIPKFAVEERDWLKALSCAPPPCSRRESGIARMILLVGLYLDERVWLPVLLKKAATLVKNIIVSALDSRSVQSDNWWLHMDSLLQEVDVTNEIEKNILLANVVVGESNLCASNVIEENTDEGCSSITPSKSQCMGARPGLLQNMSYGLCNKSGFQVLICGNPRSGQRHLASCLLHYFVGNVDVWKVDLASISHEGHGDMLKLVEPSLASERVQDRGAFCPAVFSPMRCAGSNMCVLYMPIIDLWAIETYDEAFEDGCESSSMKTQSSGKISSDWHGEVDMEDGLCPSNDVEATQSQIAAKKASYLWTSFIEQVESMRVNTSLIILATSELPLSLLPNRIRQFFGNEILNFSLSSPLDHKVPRFAVQLDGKFDHDKVINYFAAKLTKDLAQHFVQSLRGENHNHENSEKAYDIVERDAEPDRLCHSKSCHVSPSTSAVVSNKTLKGKSSLLLAISTFGYQILCYPHFAELCWVTSKLKEGPFADTNGPWKGWPFNSCIVRPINSIEKAAAASGSSNIKSKESGLVRGLIAVGLSAYRGEYTSLREVCSEVRKVLETLVGRIDGKIQAGKDRSLFIRVLSQVAYLEDMVISWANALHSLEADTRSSDANGHTCMGSSDNHVCTDGGDGHKQEASNVNVHGSEVLEKSPQEVGGRDAGRSDPTDVDNGGADAGEEVAVTVEEHSHEVVLDDICSPKQTLAPDEVNLKSFKAEAPRDHAESGHVSGKIPNGSSSDFQADGPCGSGDNHVIELSSPAEISSSIGGGSSAMCFYQCCSECFVNLHNLLLRIINIEWGLKKGSDSTVEDVHDFVASLSANLQLSLSKLSQGENSCGMTETEGDEYRKYCQCLKFQETETSECKNSDKLLMMECGCHATSKKTTRTEKNSQISQVLDSKFVFKDGVLATFGTGTDVSYHCKFEKLCLCFLIEWLVRSKESLLH